jgi:AcrR family transcriptional regulator
VPRRPDPGLEEKILNAAQTLWKKGGEKALTMRRVARAAGTNTPAVYRRFRDRDDILRGLLQRIRLEIAAELNRARSPEEGCELYVQYAAAHAQEYALFYRHNYDLHYSPRSSRAGVKVASLPVREVMRRKLTQKLGDSGDEHERVLMALWMVVHGTAMLLIEKAILPQEEETARSVLRATVRALLQNPERL